jgi:hypothetical protein
LPHRWTYNTFGIIVYRCMWCCTLNGLQFQRIDISECVRERRRESPDCFVWLVGGFGDGQLGDPAERKRGEMTYILRLSVCVDDQEARGVESGV